MTIGSALVRGDSGWNSIAERDGKGMVNWLLRIVYEERIWKWSVSRHINSCPTIVGKIQPFTAWS